MKRRIQLLISAVALSGGLQSWAEPTLYPNDLNALLRIDNTTTSNIIADTSDPTAVWVMPPNTATATVSGLHTQTAWMGYCREMRDQQTYSRQLSADIADLMRQRKEKNDELMELQRRADHMNEEAEQYAAHEGLQALVDLDLRIQSETMNLSDLNNQLEACTHDCDTIRQQILDANSALRVMRTDRNNIARQNAHAAMRYDQKKSQANAAQRTANNAKSAYLQLATDLTTIQNQFRQSFAFFGSKEGARAAILYNSDWTANVDRLHQRNPGFHFKKIPTQKADLMTVLTSVAEVDSESAIKRIESGVQIRDGAARFEAYPEALSVNVVLSLIGACPMAHPEYFDIRDNDPSKMKYGVVISYEYQTVFTAKATVTYDFYKMYQKIVESGSRGGLFSSRSWSDVSEKLFFKDSISVAWDDPENSIPQEEKDLREKAMREAVIERLGKIILPESQNVAGIVAAGPPPTRGAVVASDQLVKVCPTNIYCMGSAVVLRVLDAIFGQSSTSASYTNLRQGSVVENFSRSSKITKAWITSYL